MDRISIRKWLNKFNNGEFNKKDNTSDNIKAQIKAGRFDWFCKDTSLARKTQTMGNIVKQIKEGGKVDLDSWYA